MTTMHHFQIAADANSNEWDFGSIQYLGTIDSAEHYAKADTDEYHYDHHDGGALDRRFWEAADVEPTTANVALTIKWQK